MPSWKSLLNERRRKTKSRSKSKSSTGGKEARTEFERDYDRILFSTPVRRLADKTQVFPLEKVDSVRTRLTHSHEAANLARSIGVNLAFDHRLVTDKALCPERNIPALLAAVGLAHDLGNPPFGHQGEVAIQAWFLRNKETLFAEKHGLTEAMMQDFLRFEGNAQTFRLLTRLQVIDDDYGLNLTYGTLAALMKYTVPSDHRTAKGPAAGRKHGFFQSEAEIVSEVWSQTNLGEGRRHALTYIMEACDDIAYAVLDAEDAVKKALVSFSDLLVYLRHEKRRDLTLKEVCDRAEGDHKMYRKHLSLSPAELNDISMQKFRVHAIGAMIRDVTKAFVKNRKALIDGTFEQTLIDVSASVEFCKALKSFDFRHAYKHRSVLEVELDGWNTIHGLMDILWSAIRDRSDLRKLSSERKTPFSTYAYQRISENYRRVAEGNTDKMPNLYNELQLLTDMISGMTGVCQSICVTGRSHITAVSDPGRALRTC